MVLNYNYSAMKIDTSRTINELLVALSYVIDSEQNKNLLHSWRVSVMSALFAKRNVSAKKRRSIFYASLLHDIGGMGLPFHIIHYLKNNDRNAQTVLLSHPIIGAQFVSGIPQMSEAAKFILDHHEWIDGKGYPGAKTKKEIP